MDPNACLAEIRRLYKKQGDLGALIVQDEDLLRRHLEDLDGWLTTGGALPDDWKRQPSTKMLDELIASMPPAEASSNEVSQETLDTVFGQAEESPTE